MRRICTIAVVAICISGCDSTDIIFETNADSGMPDAGSGDTAAGDIDQHSVFDLTSPEDSSENDTTETQIATDIDSPEADLVPTDGSESPDTNSADADSEDTYDGPQIIGLEEAKALYSKYCSICHGENGDGYIADGANQLNNQSWLTTVTNDHIRQGIALGRPPTTMSSWAWPYGGPLSTIEIESLVQLIRGWQTEPTVVLSEEPIVGSAQRGAGIWEFQCASCHGSEGQGGTYSAVGHPVLLSTASDAFLRYAIAKGRPGTPMPGYENILTSQGIDDLVALLRSWAGGTIEPITEFPNDEAPAVLNPGAENADFGTEFYTPMDLIYTAYGTGQRMAIIDARPAGDYLTEHISGAISVPFYAVEQHLDRIPMDVPVIAYCACPHAESGEAAAALIAAGYTDVHVLDEGFFAWRDMGYPTSIGANP